MINIINTLIICGTVVYCIRVILSSVMTMLDNSAEKAEPCITDAQVDAAYDELRKQGDLPTDLTEFMQQMLNDED